MHLDSKLLALFEQTEKELKNAIELYKKTGCVQTASVTDIPHIAHRLTDRALEITSLYIKLNIERVKL